MEDNQLSPSAELGFILLSNTPFSDLKWETLRGFQLYCMTHSISNPVVSDLHNRISQHFDNYTPQENPASVGTCHWCNLLTSTQKSAKFEKGFLKRIDNGICLFSRALYWFCSIKCIMEFKAHIFQDEEPIPHSEWTDFHLHYLKKIRPELLEQLSYSQMGEIISNGCVKLVQFIISKIGPRFHDHAIIMAARNGELKMVQYLVETFFQPQKDDSDESRSLSPQIIREAMDKAYGPGHYDVLEYLYHKFGLQPGAKLSTVQYCMDSLSQK